MTVFKVCALIIFYFISRVALAAPCETFQGYELRQKFCWSNEVKGWLPETCMNQKCEAASFFLSKKTLTKIPTPLGGQNRAALICHEMKLPVVILKDARNNEQSFCLFNDKSLVDSAAIERHFK